MIQAAYWTRALMLCVCIRTTNLMILRHYNSVSLKHHPQSIWGGLSGTDSLGSLVPWIVHFVPRCATSPQSRKGLDCAHCEDGSLGDKKRVSLQASKNNWKHLCLPRRDGFVFFSWGYPNLFTRYTDMKGSLFNRINWVFRTEQQIEISTEFVLLS